MRLDQYPAATLRKMANGMPYRGTATKADMITFLRRYVPRVEEPACDDFYPGIPYADICSRCGIPLSTHEGN